MPWGISELLRVLQLLLRLMLQPRLAKVASRAATSRLSQSCWQLGRGLGLQPRAMLGPLLGIYSVNIAR